MVDGRALVVKVLTLRVGADQPIQITGLELVGVLGQGFQVADAIVAGPGLKYLLERQGRQGGVPTGAAAVDGQAVAVCFAFGDDIQRGVAAVVNIHDAPSSV